MPTVGYPTFEQLHILTIIAETGSFSAAARRLKRAQSVISYAVAQLEEQLGLPIFDRTGRLPQLTPAGRSILADARRVVATIDTLRARAAGLQQGLEAELRLAVDVMFPMNRLVGDLDAFATAFPTVALRLYVEAMGGVPQLLSEGVCDLGISTELAAMPAAICKKHIGCVQLIPVAAPGHTLAGYEPPVPPEPVRDATQIVLADRTAATAGQDFGVLSLATWRVADLGAKHALLRAGLGWGNMPEPMVREDLASGQLVALDLAGGRIYDYPLVLVHRSDWLPGPAAAWLAQRFGSG